MSNRIEATAKAETKLYDTVDAKRRSDILSKETVGWIDDPQDAESDKVLFHYPLFLSDGENYKKAYVNIEDLKIGEILDEPSEENISPAEFTEKEIKTVQKNKEKRSKPVEIKEVKEPVYPTVRIKPRVVLDLNNARLGNLPNDYDLISEEGAVVTIRNKASSQTFRILKSNLLGY